MTYGNLFTCGVHFSACMLVSCQVGILDIKREMKSIFSFHFIRLFLGLCVTLSPRLLDAMPFGSTYLYDENDHITLMSVVDFKSTILATSNAWLIEFYSSWCGHCIDFAPAFKQLAKDVKGKDSIRILVYFLLAYSLFCMKHMLIVILI